MKFNRRQRDGLARVFLNLAQAIFVTLIIANIAAPEKFSWAIVTLGGILFILFLVIGTFFNRGE